MTVLDQLGVPVVLAPMAGGPGTVELACAVCEAGGLGFLAAGYETADGLAAQVDELRTRTDRPFGVNLFVPGESTGEPAALAAYAERLQPDARVAGVELGTPRFDDDAWEAKLDVLRQTPPAVVSFTFGCPPAERIASLRERGTAAWVTVTTPGEARQAAEAGADALVVQGREAGGHRGGFGDDDHQPAFGLLALLQLVAAESDLPLVATGGVSSGRGLASVLAAGARAAQIGTAFLRCPEAGTSPAHRTALAAGAPTAVTRAFSGRSARGIVNAFMRDHDAAAPRAYPEVHHLTAPLRKAARAAGDADSINLWAGEAHALAVEEPAAAVVARLVCDARHASRQAVSGLE